MLQLNQTVILLPTYVLSFLNSPFPTMYVYCLVSPSTFNFTVGVYFAYWYVYNSDIMTGPEKTSHLSICKM